MTGRRRRDSTVDEWTGSYPESLQPGDYFKFGDRLWGIMAPNGEEGMIDTKIHTVTEHDDGTITVSPSILIYPHTTIDGKTPGWHGYLERGVWRSC